RHMLQQLKAEKDAYVSNWRNEVSNKLAMARQDLSTLTEEVSKSSRLSELSTLTAPVTAVVLDIVKFPSESVVKAGEPVMTLVPLNVPLEVEALIQPKDIGFLRVGDPCVIKLEAFPYHRHGLLRGKVRVVGEDQLTKDTPTGRVGVYPARVEITDMSEIRNVPDDFRLVPGMSLEVGIKVGSRRVITYLMYPIMRALDDSIRER
ncbi:MAG: HlyD family efflux transporter periplasmic adaptor subunit, partial [Acidobacteriota bacterium]